MNAPTKVNPVNRYMLRKALIPWKFQESLDEIIEFSAENGVEEVIFFIEPEEGSHGLPTLDRIRTFVPWLIKGREQLAKLGITMSINPFVTQGMRDAGWDLRAVYPDFEWLTDITGIQAKSQGCPMSPAWRKWLLDAYEIYASTGPRILWIEDDFRVHRHRPVLTACFCKRHIESFGKKMGRSFTRESLVAEILRPGEPSPLRAQWLEHVGSNMSEVVELLAQRIYGKYPDVQLGLMCSAPWTHATDRRDWDRILRALKGHHSQAVIRPGMCEYSATSPMVLYTARQIVPSTITCARLPVHACSEVETHTYSTYARSVRLTQAQILLSAACGCPSMTLNIFDHMGTPMRDEPEFGRMLRQARPMTDQLAQAFGPGGSERGVGILQDEYAAQFTHLAAGQGFPDLNQGPETWADILGALGMSITFGDSPVIAVTGQKLRGFANRLDEFFSHGVLLDLSALETLISLGRGELASVGLRGTFPRRQRETPMEALTDPEFGGGKNYFMTVDQCDLLVRIGELQPFEGSRVISHLTDPDTKPVLPGFVLSQNKLGGRVAVCPFDLNTPMPSWLLNPRRRKQLTAVVAWLFGGKIPLAAAGGVYPLAIRKDYPDRIMAFVMNLSLDNWPSVELNLSVEKSVKSIEQLDAQGKWNPLTGSFSQKGSLLRISAKQELPCAEAAVFRIV